MIFGKYHNPVFYNPNNIHSHGLILATAYYFPQCCLHGSPQGWDGDS